MNLEELQIKIGIELKELNKQLKKASDDINEHIGPKATKKMMSENNKAIKRGLDEIRRTTKYSIKQTRKDTTEEIDDMSKDIHKSLTKAFDIDLTKFNKNIDSSMVQAKRSVRSACNDIRRELNAALNIRANIHVSASTSASRQSSNSKSDAAAILASSQYTAAMIVKAINAMIDTNNKNTTRLEGAIDKSTNRIISALNKSNKTTHTVAKDNSPQRTIRVKGSKKAETTTKGQTIGQPYGPDYKPLIDALKNAYKTINILNRGLSALNNLKNIKQLGTGSSGMQGKTVNWRQGKKGSTIPSFEGEVVNPVVIPVEPFKQIQDIIEVINYEVKDFETGLVKVGSRAISVSKALENIGLNNKNSQPLKGEVIDSGKLRQNKGITQKEVIIPAEFKVIDDDLQQQINDAVSRIKMPKLLNTNTLVPDGEGILDTSQVDALKQVQKLKHKINNTPLQLDVPTEDYEKSAFAANELHRQIASLVEMGLQLNMAFRRTPDDLGNIVEQANFLEGAFEAVVEGAKELTSVVPEIANSFDFGKKALDDMAPGVKGLVKEIKDAAAKKQKPKRPDGFVPKQGVSGQLTKPQRPDWYNPTPGVEKTLEKPQRPDWYNGPKQSKPIDIEVNDEATKKLESIKNQILEIQQEFDFIAMEELPNFAIDENLFKEQFGSIEEYASDLYDLYEDLQKLDDESIKLNIDTEDARKQIKDLQEIIAIYIDSISNGEIKDNIKAALGTSNKPQRTEAKPSKTNKNEKPSKPTIMGFGFGAYKNEIEMLQKALKELFDPNIGPAKLDKALTSIGKTARKVADTITNGLGKAFSLVVDNVKKAGKAIDKVFTGIANSVGNLIKIYTIGTSVMIKFFKLGVEKLGLIKTLIKFIEIQIQALPAVIKTLGKAIFGPTFDFIVNAIKKCGNAIVNFGKAVANVAKKVKDAIMGVITPVLDYLEEKFGKVITVIRRVGRAIADVARKIKDTLVSAINTAVNFISNAFDKCVEAIRSFGRAIVDVATKIRNSLMITFAYALDVIEDTINKCINAIKKFGKAIVDVARKIKDILVGAFNKVVDAIKKLGKAIADIATRIKNYLMIAFAYIADVVEDAINKCINAIKKLGKAIANLANKIKDILVNAFNKAIDFIVDKFDKLVEAVKKLGRAIVDVAIRVKNHLMITFAYALDIIEDKINKCIEVIKKLGRAIANLANKIKNVLVNAFNKTIDFIVDKFDKLVETIKKLGRAVANVATKIKNSLMISFAYIVDVIADKFNSLKTIVSNMYGHIVNLSRAYDIVIRRHLGKLASYMEGLANKIVQPLKTAMSKIATVIKNQYNQIAAAVKLSINNVIDSAKNMYNQVAAAIKLSIDNIITATKNQYNQLSAAIKTSISNIVTAAKNQYNQLSAAIETTINNIVTATKNQYNQVAAAIGYSFNKVTGSVKNAVTKVKNVTKEILDEASDFAESCFNKISSFSSSVAKGVSKAASSSINSVKKLSKEMKEKVFGVFKQKKEGFIDFGKVEKGLNNVKSATKKIAKDVKDSLGGAFDSVGDKFKKNGVLKQPKQMKTKLYTAYTPDEDTIDYSGLTKTQEKFHKMLREMDKAAERFAVISNNALGVMFPNVDLSWLHDMDKHLYKTFETLRKELIESDKKINAFVIKARNKFKTLFPTLSKAISNIKTSKLYNDILKTLSKTKVTVSKFASNAKSTLNKVFTSIKTGKLHSDVAKALNKARTSVSKFTSNVRVKLNKAFDGIKSTKLYTSIAPALNKAKAAVSKFASKVRPILNKAFSKVNFSGIAKNISKGLNGAKKALSKFANSCKTIWGKIKQIFSKGAKDASAATGKLTTGLKGLLSKALGFFSLYALINLGKQAITQSQTLAQAEVKLTSLMKQRMGATNDTVRAIRELAKEQANLGVVSETAMVRGAEQLSMYVHSAQALKTLMPAIANLTARRGGFNATPEDAEEMATQLGEAIREGTTTPLEQSGIYLSEAEIKKFQALRTEEERAAYLADVIAKNVGNINEALANTPHGQIAQLKNNFQSLLGTLGTLLVNVIQPIVKWLNVVVVAANNALKALGELLGFDMSGGGLAGVDLGTGSTGTGVSGVDSVTDSYKDATDAAEEATEANEKFKGSLMGFDEINTLSDNTNKDSKDGSEELDPTDITPGDAGQLIPTEITEGENIFDKFGEKMKAFMDEVLEPFKAAWDLLGERWKTAWADLLDSFKNFCDSLASFLKSVWENGGKEFVQHMAEIGLACGIAAMEIGGTILDALAKLWDHLDPEKNMHTQRLLDVLNEVSVKLRDFILGLNEHLENLLEYGGQDVLNAMGDCFMDLAAAAVNAFGVVIDAVDGLIDHLDPKFNQDTRNMLQAVADMFHATGEAAWDFSELLRSALENGGQDLINGFGTMMVNLGETVARVITTMMESLSEFFDYIDPAKNDITREMMKSWEEAFYAIGDAALEFADLFESVMDNGGQEVLNKLGDAFNSLVGLVGDCVKEIADALDGLFEHLDPKTNQFTQDMLSAWERAFEDIADMCGSLSDLLGSAMDNGGQELVNSVGDLGMKLGEAFGVIVEECAETFSGLFEHMNPENNEHSKKMMDALDGLVDSITEFVDACVEAFQKFMDNGGREIVNNLGDILAIVIDLAAELGSGIIDIITGFMNSWVGQTLIEGVAQALEWVTEKLVDLSDTFDVVKDIFQNIVDIIVGVFEGDGEKVGRAFADLIKNAFKLTGELIQWLWDLGCDLVEGLIKGICALPKLLWDAVQFIFDTIVGFFKELFGIHSPSTVFAELGEFLIEGLVEGIKDAINLVTDAFKKVGDAISKATKEIVKAVTDKFKEMKDGIKDKLKETKEVVSEKWNEIKQTVSEKSKDIYDNTKEKWTNIKDTVSEKSKATCDAIKENWANVKQTATDIFTETYNVIRDKWANIKDTVSEKAKSTYEIVKDNWNNLKQNTSDKFKDTYEIAKDKFTSIRDTIKDKTTQTYEDVSASWTKIKDDAATKLEQIRTDAEKRYEQVKDTLVGKIDEAKTGIIEKWEEVRNKTNECIENVRQTSEEKYNEIKETIVERLEDIKSKTSDKWEEIKKNTGESVENIKKEADEQYAKIKDSLVDTLDKTKTAMATKWDNIKSDAISKATEIANQATTKFGEIKNTFATKLDETKSNLTSKWKNLSTQGFNGAKDIVSQAKSGLSNLGQTMADAVTSGKSKVKSALAEVGRLFGQVDWSIPKLPMPHIQITGKWGFNPPSIPSFKVNWYARGGIIDGMTPLGFANGALQMGGEAGKEMVVPLENTSFTSKIAQAMGQAVDNALARNYNNISNNNNSNSENRDVVLQLDGREFARASINSINKLQRESGRTLLDI